MGMGMGMGEATPAGLAVVPPVAHEDGFYINDGTGNDSGDGSFNHPWKTHAPVNTYISVTGLQPGDKFHYNGGDTFTGTLAITGFANAGTVTAVEFKSYGTGQAIFSPGDNDAILLTTCSNVTFDSLHLHGPGVSTSGVTTSPIWAGGIRLQNLAATTMPNITVKNCLIEGFSYGLMVSTYDLKNDPGALSEFTGFSNGLVDNCIFSNGGFAGMNFIGLSSLSARRMIDWTITDTEIYHFHGQLHPDFGSTPIGGSGILLQGATGFTIEDDFIHDNGIAKTYVGLGPAGIVTAYTTNIVMRRITVARQHAQNGDGGGIELGDVDSITNLCEQCLTIECDNTGYGLFGSSGIEPQGCILRHCIDINSNMLQPSSGSGWIASSIQGSALPANMVYRNTFYNDRAVTGGGSCADMRDDKTVYADNLFIMRNALTSDYIIANGGAPAVLVNNCYDSDQAFKVIWNDVFYTSLAALHTAGGEKFGGINYGLVANSRLSDLGYDTDTFPPTDLTAYDPTPSSPTIGAGLDLVALGVVASVGTVDFHANPIVGPYGYDIGAVTNQTTFATPATPSAPTLVVDNATYSIALTWPAVPQAGGYIIQHSTSSGAETDLATVYNTTGYTFHGDGAAATDYFKIKAFNNAGTSAASAEASASITPFTSATVAGQKYWGKAGVQCYQDTGGTTPATANNDPVALSKDQSGNGNDVSQATSGSQPLLKTNAFDGRAALEFDGSDDFLSGVLSDLNLTGPVAVFLVFKPLAYNAAFMLAGVASAGAAVGGWILGGGATAKHLGLWHDGGGPQGQSDNALTEGSPYLAAVIRTGSTGAWSIAYRVNRVAHGTTSTATNPGSDSHFAESGFGAFNAYHGLQYQRAEILVYDWTGRSNSDRDLVETYLAAKYPSVA